LVCRHFKIKNKADKSIIALINNPNLHRKLIAVGFDGILHDNKPNGFSPNALEITNPPIKGALTWLTSVVKDTRFVVTIYSVRAKHLDFEKTFRAWLRLHEVSEDVIMKITVSATKPPASVFVEECSWKFTGKFPKLDELYSFKPWYEN
jgi:hypothetical protein